MVGERIRLPETHPLLQDRGPHGPVVHLGRSVGHHAQGCLGKGRYRVDPVPGLLLGDLPPSSRLERRTHLEIPEDSPHDH